MTSREISPPGFEEALVVFGRIQSSMNRALTSLDLTETRRNIILELSRRPASTSADIARRTGIDPAQLSRALPSLIVGGFVATAASERHRSQSELTLTQEGEQTALRIRSALTEIFPSIFASLTPSEQGFVLSSWSLLSPRASGEADVAFQHVRTKHFGWIVESWDAVRNELGWQSSFMDHGFTTLSHFLRQAGGYECNGWMALRAGMPIGVSLLIIQPDLLSASVRLTYVDPFERNRGVGRQLLAKIIERAREIGLTKLQAHVSERQVELDRLFRKSGFKRDRYPTENVRFGPLVRWRKYELNLPLAIDANGDQADE